MKLLSRIIILVFALTDAFLVGKILLTGKNVQILNPQGFIALQERDLLFLCLGIMFIIVIPVFILAIHVGTHYHQDNKKAKYDPDWQSSKLQIFLWSITSCIILILCVINWVSAHQLDPHNSLVNSTKPLTIQVVALRWKWLFIYPDQNIATVNYVVFPEKTPIAFQLTASDTPMNSFWIPQLGGQIYAMSGMSTQTHLIADSIGMYRGSSAEISGQGFADMDFTAKSVSQTDFNAWVSRVKLVPQKLTADSFETLNKPSQAVPPEYFSSAENNLYTTIVTKYMAPGQSMSSEAMSGMSN